MEWRDEAWKEIVVLQDIIHKQEDLRTKTKNWSIVLFGGITIAYTSSTTDLDYFSYFVASSIIILTFLLLENLQRSIQMTTILRRNFVEKQLRDNMLEYNGPKIGKSFSSGFRFLSIFNLRLMSVYGSLFLITVSLYFTS